MSPVTVSVCFRKPFSALAFSHDGKHLVTGEVRAVTHLSLCQSESRLIFNKVYCQDILCRLNEAQESVKISFQVEPGSEFVLLLVCKHESVLVQLCVLATYLILIPVLLI